MATRPNARGRGAGTSVLQALVQHAMDHGATRVCCNARTGARTLYERAGFVWEGYLDRHYPRRNGELWGAVVMGLVLDG